MCLAILSPIIQVRCAFVEPIAREMHRAQMWCGDYNGHVPANRRTPAGPRRNAEEHRRQVLALLREDASRAQAEIAALVGVDDSTVSRIIASLEAEGLRRIAYLDLGAASELTIVEIQLEAANNQEKARIFGHFAPQQEVLECFAVSGDAVDIVVVLDGGSATYRAWFETLPIGIRSVRSHQVFDRLRGFRPL